MQLRSVLSAWSLTVLTLTCLPPAARAAGTLTPVNSPETPLEIVAHRVSVVIHDGFARTEVTQVFHNPNSHDLEAIYAFPVPESASLAEVTLQMGENRIDGEVVARERAEQVYVEERDRGEDAGLAVKNSYRTFEFAVSPVRAASHAEMRFVYYQPLQIDTGVGRYLYPLQDGGTDAQAASFWVPNSRVQGDFSIEVEIKSAWPLADVRVPGHEAQTSVQRDSDRHYRVSLAQQGASLDRDFVLYYRLQDGLPGRVEVIPYRADESGAGTFMAVVTPGIDLAPLRGGADYSFVLDTSGSMQGKLGTLAEGVVRTLGQLDARDRFRIITFSSSAAELTRGWTPATREQVSEAASQVSGLQAGGSTNLFDAVRLAVSDLDDDRATSVILVTDAVANTGVVDPRAFHALLKRYDVRVFGFLMGNGASWPLMRAIADASGGFYAGVSNADDIIGQILLARSKVTYEALHDAELRLTGVRTSEVTGLEARKIYRGQQLVLFGRYAGPGRATLELRARLTGEDKVYTTTFDFPAVATDHPELERLWALARIEQIQTRAQIGLADASESNDAVRDLGVQYQIVTDETSMLVLPDAAFRRHGIERRNRERVTVEREAQARRAAAPPQNHRVDRSRPTFSLPTPSLGGGGALDPLSALLCLGFGGSAVWAQRRSRKQVRS